MYSHVFNFTYAKSLSLADQLRFAAELCELPEKLGYRPTDIYWLRLTIDGEVELYSNRPTLTTEIEARLKEAEGRGLLRQSAPGWRSGLLFLGRVVSGFARAALRAVIRR